MSSAAPTRPPAVRSAAPAAALITVAVIWGITYSVADGATSLIPAADLIAWRFGLAAVLLVLVRRPAPPMPLALRRRGVLLGVVLGLGFLLQTWALTYTDALMSGFLIGTLVVMAPLTGWALFRERPAAASWSAIAVAIAGLALLSLRGSFGAGEVLTLLAAALWALHLVLLARWARPDQALGLARIQTTTVAALAVLVVAVGGVIRGGPVLPQLPATAETWRAVVFLALLPTAGAMVLLSWAQSRMTATRAAIILTLEPAAAGLTAAALGSEFGIRTITGGVLLIAAMLIVELGARRTAPGWLRRGTGRHRIQGRRTGRSPFGHRSSAIRTSMPPVTGVKAMSASDRTVGASRAA